MWERLQRFNALDPAARGLFPRACALLPLISVGLLVRGFGATRATLQRFLPSQNQATAQLVHPDNGKVSQTARMVRAAAHFTPRRFTCLEKSLALVGQMQKGGVKILAGTDSAAPYVVPGFSLHEELALLVKAGLTPMEALQAATRNPAEFLGHPDRQGVVLAVGHDHLDRAVLLDTRARTEDLHRELLMICEHA